MELFIILSTAFLGLICVVTGFSYDILKEILIELKKLNRKKHIKSEEGIVRNTVY